MALLSMKTLYSYQIWEDSENSLVATSPSKAYIVNEDTSLPPSTSKPSSATEITNCGITKVQSGQGTEIKRSILVALSASFDSPQTYTRVYITNSSDKTLISYDYETVTNALVFGESYSIELTDLDEIIGS